MYKIVRYYMRKPRPGEGGHLVTSHRTIETGLTLEQAQAHCHDPETSSSMCARNRVKGWDSWFDGYQET